MRHTTIYMEYTGIYHVRTELAQIQNAHTVFSILTRSRCRLHVTSKRECTNIGKSPWNAIVYHDHCMYIQLYALYIETCITSNMYIHLYALYIEERQGVRIPDDWHWVTTNNNLNHPDSDTVTYHDTSISLKQIEFWNGYRRTLTRSIGIIYYGQTSSWAWMFGTVLLHHRLRVILKCQWQFELCCY